jgi:hypothetical protein
MIQNWKHFRISLTNPNTGLSTSPSFFPTNQTTQPCYLAGQKLRGAVELDVIEQFKINSMKLNLCGKCKVNWSEKQGDGRFNSRILFCSYETLIDQTINIVSIKYDAEIGKHSFPFEFDLPANLPSSFEHAYGSINYSLCCTMEIPWSLNKHCKLPLHILALIDLNQMPQLNIAYHINNTKTLCCFCCRSQPIRIYFTLFKRAFLPGQSICFNLIINNQSSRKICFTVLKLVQTIKFITKLKTRVVTRDLACCSLNEEIMPFKNNEYHHKTMRMPAQTSPSSLKTSKLIEISYKLILHIQPNWPSRGKIIEFPIVVGTVPFNSTNDKAKLRSN